MTNVKLGGWLFVAFALVGLALVSGLVGAHGNGPTADDAHSTDGPAGDWAAWMAGHMTDYMGPGPVEWMGSHMGVTVDERDQHAADDDHHDGGRHGNGHC